MSADTGIDQRLREAFHADDDWIPDVSLADVRARPLGAPPLGGVRRWPPLPPSCSPAASPSP